MILQREIAAIAQTKHVAKLTIDKDWVLGHFLDAIYSIDYLKDMLVFKGGTCLKKNVFYPIIVFRKIWTSLAGIKVSN